MSRKDLDDLVDDGLLRECGAERWWLLPGNEPSPAPPAGYVVSFVHFHERGVGAPASDFFRGVLFQYKLELQHLNPNGV